MTAILGCAYARMPFLMGDIIVSMAQEHAPVGVHIPSVGRVELPPHDQRRISGFVQKVSIIGPNLAFAWSGDVSAARNILTPIREANQIRPFDSASLAQYFNINTSSSLEPGGDVGLICLVKTGPKWKMVGINVQHFLDQRFTAVFADGTGHIDLKAQLQNLGSMSSSNSGNPTQEVIGMGIGLAGTLITHEAHSLESLKKLYGGAYEMATIIDGECAKVDDIMYVHWFADMNEEGFTFRSLTHVFRYCYWNDLLIVRSVKFPNGPGSPEQHDGFRVIPTIFREPAPDELDRAPIPHFAASIVSHQITFRALDGEIYAVSRIDFSRDSGFKIVEKSLPNDKHQIEIHVHPNFISETANKIRRVMQR